MTALYYFNPITVTRNLFTKDALQWSRVYNLIGQAVGMNDRSGTLKQPIKLSVHEACRLPSLDGPELSYDDCAQRRAQEIWDASLRLDKPIGIMWSGGIDSTMVVVSFLRLFNKADLKSRVRIITSTEATLENPDFYQNYILPNFDFVVSEHTPWLMDRSIMLVTGEHNDQLFGSDLIRYFLTSEGSDRINSRFDRNFIFNYINAKIDREKVTNVLIDKILESSGKIGIELEKNTDFFWWYNFCFKWQAVHFRIYALTFPRLVPEIDKEFDREYLYHFYETHDFQRWSIRNPQVRYINDWKNYKLEAKKSIFAYDKDEEYFRIKIKRPSMQTVFNHRLLNEAVTEDFKILEKFIPLEFYNMHNDFR